MLPPPRVLSPNPLPPRERRTKNTGEQRTTTKAAENRAKEDGTHMQVHILSLGDGFEVHVQDLLPPPDIGVGHHHVAVKAAGPHQRLVQRLGEVGGRDDDDACVWLGRLG